MPRYEIHLPVTFNDGSPIPEDLFMTVKEELVSEFGGLTILPPGSPAEGWWESGGVLYRDDILIYRVTSTEDKDEFINEYKRILANRFKQERIWVERLEARPM